MDNHQKTQKISDNDSSGYGKLKYHFLFNELEDFHHVNTGENSKPSQDA